MLPVPKPLPEWWIPFCRYRFGLVEQRPDAPKPAPKWCLQEWSRFVLWNDWKNDGGKRPATIWRKVPQWAWALRRELLAKRKGSGPPPSDPPPPKSVTAPVLLKPGIFMYSAGNTVYGAEGFCNRAAAAGFKWVAMLAHEGANLPQPHINPPDWLLAIRASGMKAVAWGGLFTEPEREAQRAAQAVELFDLYIPNPELPYKLTTSQEAFERADRFVAELRKHTNKVGAISTLVGADIHFKPFVDAGFDVLMPQAYINDPQYAGNTPRYAIERAMGSVQHDFPGWRAEHVAPTIASYGDHQRSMEWWKPYLAEAGCLHRWSYYTGEFMRDADFATVRGF